MTEIGRSAPWPLAAAQVVRSFYPEAALHMSDAHVRALPISDTPVDVSRSPEVVYHSSKKPLHHVRGFHMKAVEPLANVSAEELLGLLAGDAFLDHVLPADGGGDGDHILPAEGGGGGASCPALRRWHYYAATNDSSAAVAAVRRSIPMASLLERRLVSMAGAPLHSENLWIGGGGVSAWAHYDASWNAFLQLRGTKRWLLVDPVMAESRLAPYSFLHPAFRRTQLHPTTLSGGDGGSVNGSERAEGEDRDGLREVNLHAGDLLLLPPFIFHHVTAASSVTIAFNMWACDGATRRVQRLVERGARSIGLPPPTLERMSRESKAACVEAAAIELVVAAELAPTADAARAWIAGRMRERWRPVLQRYPRGLGRLRRYCATGKAREARRTLAAVHGTPADWARAVEDAAGALRAVRDAGGEALETANLIEQAALDALSDARTAGSFLIHCFLDEDSGSTVTSPS